MITKKENFRTKSYEKSINLSKDSVHSIFNKHCHRESSNFSKYLLIKEGNSYSTKCNQLWNNFIQPTKPTFFKYPLGVKNLEIKNSRLIMRKEKNKNRIDNKIPKISKKIIKANFPPIKKIITSLGYNDLYHNWNVDSDDEDGILQLHKN